MGTVCTSVGFNASPFQQATGKFYDENILISIYLRMQI